MLTGHRYRVIIYFAALVLCLSVCFAFAEEPASLDHCPKAPAGVTNSNALESMHFLYYSAPGRASFLPALSGKLIPEPAAPITEVASADTILQQLGSQSERHRNLHSLFSGRHHLKLVRTYTQEQQQATSYATATQRDASSQQ